MISLPTYRGLTMKSSGCGDEAARSTTGDLVYLGLSSATRAPARPIACEASGEAGHLVHRRDTLRPLLSMTVG